MRIRNDLGRWVLARDVVRVLGKDALNKLKKEGLLRAKGRTLFLVVAPVNGDRCNRISGGAA